MKIYAVCLTRLQSIPFQLYSLCLPFVFDRILLKILASESYLYLRQNLSSNPFSNLDTICTTRNVLARQDGNDAQYLLLRQSWLCSLYKSILASTLRLEGGILNHICLPGQSKLLHAGCGNIEIAVGFHSVSRCGFPGHPYSCCFPYFEQSIISG